MTNNKPQANNEPNNQDFNNSDSKTFGGSNEPSSFSQKPLPYSCELKTIERNHIDLNKLNDILDQILINILHTT